MNSSPNLELGQQDSGTPDPQYAFVVGLYIATLVAPAVVLVLSGVVSDAGVLYVSLLGTGTVIAAITGWVVSRIPGIAVSLGRSDATWSLVVIPLTWFGGVFGAAAVGIEPPDVAGPLAVVSTGGGFFLGLIVVTMSRNRHAAVHLECTETLARWKSRWPRQWRRVSLAGATVALLLSILGFVAELGFGIEGVGNFYFFIFIWIPLSTHTTNPRTFHVTPHGLGIERPMQRHFRPWSAFEGYELTEKTLVIRSAAWWRPSHRCDRTDINDIDGAVEALDSVFTDR